MLFVWVALIVRLLRRATVNRDPELLRAARALPLGLAIGLDLMDLGLDFASAPFAWLLVTRAAKSLDRPELKRLRGLTLVESLMPGTQLIPIMTITWLYANHVAPHDEVGVVLEGVARQIEPIEPVQSALPDASDTSESLTPQ